MNKYTFSRPSALLLIYGVFAVICHAAAVFFASLLCACLGGGLCARHGGALLEHSLMSFCLILAGALAIEYACSHQSDKRRDK